ncbi:unnamed protein product [Rotaria sordida]|uniref:Potassium channel domain-containing protein n=1 Tax=Rotaria sordida TaxID=392033 RepID=A0A815CTV5_9BILA|nr:unnamed protein product [Rotaria sordida]CAF1567651.1 unnamed protein product [Rotaria sordida]
MSTVGYGDISCKTYLGRFFVLLFLMSGLAVFATIIPVLPDLFGSKGPYAGQYKTVKGKRHVVICGYIAPHSLAPFLRDFLHKGRNQADKLDVVIIDRHSFSKILMNTMFLVFIDRKTPEIEMEALLKRYYTKVHYFVGSIMNIADLQRIQVDKATACLIIADKEYSDPNSDDSANIMRVISWNTDEDEIICIAELKLGLIGMSCVAPGFSTMMTNIFRMSSYNALAAQRKVCESKCLRNDLWIHQQ